jgi:hypothetical protein
MGARLFEIENITVGLNVSIMRLWRLYFRSWIFLDQGIFEANPMRASFFSAELFIEAINKY